MPQTRGSKIRNAAQVGKNEGLERILNLIPLGREVIEAPDANGWTPMMCGLVWGRLECTRTLLSKGANIEAKDRCGRTPLIIAASNGELECCLSGGEGGGQEEQVQ